MSEDRMADYEAAMLFLRFREEIDKRVPKATEEFTYGMWLKNNGSFAGGTMHLQNSYNALNFISNRLEILLNQLASVIHMDEEYNENAKDLEGYKERVINLEEALRGQTL